MRTSIFTLFACLLLLLACQNKDELLSPEIEAIQVRFIDFEASCNENLELLNGQTKKSFDGSFSSKFLYGNTWDFPAFAELKFGETLRIKYEVLEEAPYPFRLVLCKRVDGIPIKILEAIP